MLCRQIGLSCGAINTTRAFLQGPDTTPGQRCGIERAQSLLGSCCPAPLRCARADSVMGMGPREDAARRLGAGAALPGLCSALPSRRGKGVAPARHTLRSALPTACSPAMRSERCAVLQLSHTGSQRKASMAREVRCTA